ncbi:cytolysin immunity CylI domain protein, putative [Acaryochloris marina MBIC11017]|uniref:Cytolysin immunity CylI domain protein, putative n=1 Tax=Acaryochloris marina (strain MBIC 11017) TaxID=329726 RepID=B0C3D4_ACAM1|nr:cytolysin immunity CylI domain protein, putative [Acaryochloris marina MBIC11017]
MVESCFGLISGGFLGFLLGTYLNTWWNTTFGVSALVGSLVCGLLYSLITVFALRHIAQRKYIFSQPSETASKYDNPPNHKTWLDNVITLFPLLVIMGGWWWVLPPVPPSGLPPIVKPLIFLGIFYPYQYFAIFIHELGHYLFSWVNGSELYRFAIGRLILIQTDQGFKLRRCRRQLAGGFAEPIPTSLHRLDRQLFLMIMGGPAASLLLFCFGALPVLFPNLTNSSPIVWYLTFISGISLHMAIFNTIPIKIGYFSTDGRRMLDLAKRNIPGQRFLADYQFNAYLRQGIRPKDIDPDLKNRLLALPENSMDHISGLIMAYYMTLDQGNIQQAGNYLDQALKINAYYPELFRASLLLEGAYYEAHIRQHPDVAQQWLDQIQEKVLIDPSTRLRAEAAIHLAAGDKTSAQTKAEESLAILQKPQFLPGFTVFEQDRLQVLLHDLATP